MIGHNAVQFLQMKKVQQRCMPYKQGSNKKGGKQIIIHINLPVIEDQNECTELK